MKIRGHHIDKHIFSATEEPLCNCPVYSAPPPNSCTIPLGSMIVLVSGDPENLPVVSRNLFFHLGNKIAFGA